MTPDPDDVMSGALLAWLEKRYPLIPLEEWLERRYPPTAPTLPQWLTIMQAARHASVSRTTIYTWFRQGRLRTTRTVSGHVRIDPSSLFQDEPHG